MNNFEKFIDGSDIHNKIKSLADLINEYYKNSKEDIVVTPVLNGAMVFAGHLMTSLKFPTYLLPIKVSAYGKNIVPSQDPKLFCYEDSNIDLAGKQVLIIEDLIDKGHNLKTAIKFLKSKNVKEIKICCLLNKLIDNHENRGVLIDWAGFNIPDKWVCGFGIDSQEKFRNLPDIMVKVN